jgi:pimeloyl-ACP methyl ester carboxylesterase
MPTALSRNSTNVRNAINLLRYRAQVAIAHAMSREKAVDLAARLFTTPPRIPHTARELELLATGTRFEVRDGKLSLMAWRFGGAQRPAVLLSHGWGGRGAQLRSFVAPLLDAGYQVILFDHVGHGHSGGVTSTLVHFVRGLDAMVRNVEADGTRIHAIVGHSLGAAAAGAWLNRTGREMRVVLVAPPTSLERYSGFFARKLGIPESVRRAMQERFERALGMPWKDFELPQSVANVRASALVIHDADDAEVSCAAGVALARAWPGARFVATHGLGHRGVLRDDEVVHDVVDFIAARVVFPPPPAGPRARLFGATAPIL